MALALLPQPALSACQKRAADAWRRARIAELLDVPYCPPGVHAAARAQCAGRQHPRWVYETLMACSAATLTRVRRQPPLARRPGAFTLVLHTWTQDLRRHLHAHALMACGALSSDGRWRAPARARRFLFPVHALSRVLAASSCAALAAAERSGTLPRDPAAVGRRARRAHAAAARHDWVVYAKTPLAGPAAVLDYLARYTHRTAVGNERIVAIAR